ncbi:peptide-methionine (S)-S-oxide reductase MsrA [Halopenitus sp. H-Gu1]|uniref:peptide-methionine (S)-S-oxide reductase MsrA n=1 Tax=Halopenitus sp. H-Gu1 TaxID=3242697 RepID=UPI00359EA1E4
MSESYDVNRGEANEGDESNGTATFGGGCFWCLEAAVEEIEGVESVTSGYAGGEMDDPTYREVCTGTTGHAEVVQLEYDPETVEYEELLEVFFTIHDPTQLNRQGPDVGTQYRSIILTHDDEQQQLAETYVEALEAEGGYDDPVVTEIEPLETFWRAEEKHQNYFEKNPQDAYCRMHAQPKVETVRERFRETATK